MDTGIGAIIAQLGAGTITATTIYGLALLSFLDFVTGITKAFQTPGDGFLHSAFKLAYFDAWVKTKATKLINVILVLVVGQALPDFSVLGFNIAPITGLGVAWGGTFAASLIGSIKDNVDPSNRIAVPDEALIGG